MEEMEETHTDYAGRTRRFRTVLRESPGGLCAESTEVTDSPGGYRFRVVVSPGAVGRAYYELRERMSRILNTRHVERNPETGWSTTHDTMRGWIDCDSETREPVVVVDGEPISWSEFGRLLLIHEGFEFELRFTE